MTRGEQLYEEAKKKDLTDYHTMQNMFKNLFIYLDELSMQLNELNLKLDEINSKI